jgi:hypothetical protein
MCLFKEPDEGGKYVQRWGSEGVSDGSINTSIIKIVLFILFF